MLLLKLKYLLAAALMLAGVGAASAQTWPAANVRIVVPYPPGTEPDLLARDLGEALSKTTQKAFVIENRPGANSMIGTQEVVKGGADGSTLLLVDRMAVVANPYLFSTVAYRWEEALKPVSDLAKVELYVAVNTQFPARNYAEFLSYAKAHPDQVIVGTGGNGHVMHIGMAMVAQAHGLSFTYVPFRGGAPAMMALAAGDVNTMMAGAVTMAPHIPGKRIRVLTFGGDQRSSVLPEVPTVAEAGGKAGSIPSTTFALLAPSKVSDDVIATINGMVKVAMDRPQIKSAYAARGMDVVTTTPEQTLASMRQEASTYEAVIRQAGIGVE